jgi:hypothetical protein
MFAFLKLVATIAACLSVSALAGAYMADMNGYSSWLSAGLSGMAGIAFGLVAAGESRGRFLDMLFPPDTSHSG